MKNNSEDMPNADPAVNPALIAHMTRNEADMAFKKRVQTIFEWISRPTT